MFTGLVEETGDVDEFKNVGEGKRLKIVASKVLDDIGKGESICVSGACLTVESFDSKSFEVFLAKETMERTWFSSIEKGKSLNLERSLTLEDRMGGHYVQGHVDATAEILEVEELEEGWNFRFTIPEVISGYIVEKGFIAVEGISLTVSDICDDWFEVTIIPETWKVTNLSERKEGDKVNLEADIMAKYAEKAIEKS